MGVFSIPKKYFSASAYIFFFGGFGVYLLA